MTPLADRILSLERAGDTWRVVSWWKGSPFSPPRTLLTHRGSLADLPTQLTTRFTEPLDPAQTAWITSPDESADLAHTFPAFSIFTSTLPTDERLYALFAPTPDTLISWLDSGLAPYTPTPQLAHTDLSQLRAQRTIHIVGCGQRALEWVSLTCAEYFPVTSELLSLDQSPSPTPPTVLQTVVAIGSDPGIALSEGQYLESGGVGVVVNTNPAFFESDMAQITQFLPAPLFLEQLPKQFADRQREVLATWVIRHCPDDHRATAQLRTEALRWLNGVFSR